MSRRHPPDPSGKGHSQNLITTDSQMPLDSECFDDL